MGLIKYQFKAGIDREGTDYTAENGWYNGDKIRFRSGHAEKIGGWIKYSSSTFEGTARSLYNYAASDATHYVGVGTHLKFYIADGTTYNDITPIRATTSAGDVTFSASNGDATLTVADTAHGAVANDFVTYSGAATLGGLITATVLNQEYQIATIVNANSYTIEAKDTDGDEVTANSSDSGNGGASVVGAYQMNVGLDEYIYGVGWGVNTWSDGTWGSSASQSFTNQLRLWTLDNFGEDMVCNPRNGGIYYWDATNGVSTRAVNFTSLSDASDVPTISSQIIVSEIDRHIICLGANTIGTSVQDPMLVRWCDQEDAADWTPTTTNTAGSLRLSAGSKIVGGLRTRQEIAIFTDNAIYSMQFIGPPFTFGINLVSESVSMVSPQACTNANNAIYFMDKDNFYVYEGGIQVLPCTVRAYVFDNFNYSQIYKVFAMRNAKFNEVSWFYCSSSSDEIDRYVTYNYLDRVWSIGTMPRTAWMDIGASISTPLAAGASGTTTNYLYNQETGSNDDESAMTSYIESADFDAGDGDQFMFINRLIPDIYFYGSSGDPAITYSIKTRDYPLGTLTTATTASVGSTTGVSYIRARARQMRIRIESTDSDNLWRLGDTRFDIKADGRR